MRSEPDSFRIEQAALRKPVDPANYTDFYASIHHATRVGRLFRPDQPLLPNYKFVPIGYHGRASSIVVSGTPVRRPRGQTNQQPERRARLRPHAFSITNSKSDSILRVGNPLGDPVPIARPATTSSASRWSTTGPPATSSPGNTSRSGRFSPKLRHQRLAVGRAHRRSRALSRSRLARAPPRIPPPLDYLLERDRPMHRRHRHHTGSIPAHRSDARRRPRSAPAKPEPICAISTGRPRS